MASELFRCPVGSKGRIDSILSESFPSISRTWIKRAIEEGRVSRKDGSLVEPKTKVTAGQEFRIDLTRPATLPLEPFNFALNILYENKDVHVVDKVSGMVTHPAEGTPSNTLVNALLHARPEEICPIGAPNRPGIVHRLDKETSGVIVVAKTEKAHQALVSQFSTRQTKKRYLALVSGKLRKRKGKFQLSIGRHPKNRVKMAVCEDGKPALTYWRVKTLYEEGFSLVDCEIETGRTHQIRVHFSHASHPLAGDKTYGYRVGLSKSPIFSRVMLHAFELSFCLPGTDQPKLFRANPPEDFTIPLQELTPLDEETC